MRTMFYQNRHTIAYSCHRNNQPKRRFLYTMKTRIDFRNNSTSQCQSKIDILLINFAALYITWAGTIQWDNNLQGILSFAIQDSSSLYSFNYNAVSCIYVGMIRQRLSNSWRTDSDVDVREVKQTKIVKTWKRKADTQQLKDDDQIKK